MASRSFGLLRGGAGGDPVKGIAMETEPDDPIAERYESPTAMTLGLIVFSSSFLGLFVAAALASHSMLEFLAAALLWPACLLWLNWCVLVPGRQGQRQRRRGETVLGCVGLFLAPVCVEATRRGPG